MNDLRKLTDVELENSLGVHVRNERLSLDHIYSHINEVYRRELHLDNAYGSMKTYLTPRWKYSERDAYRKIDGARLLKDVPELAAEIRNGAVNADVIGEVSRAVKEKERVSGEKLSPAVKTELVAMVSGKSVSESQQVLSQKLDIKVKAFELKRVQADKSVRLELTASEDIYARLKICQDHAAHKIQQENLPHNLETMLKVFTDLYIKVNKLEEFAVVESVEDKTSESIDPIKMTDEPRVENEIVRSRTEKSSATVSAARSARAVVRSESLSSKKKLNKSLTPKTRRAVFKRDRCCQYKDPETGEICGETRFVQVDHKISLWAGGTHELENLQLLCANHNRRKYRKEAQMSWL